MTPPAFDGTIPTLPPRDSVAPADWSRQLAEAIREPAALLAALGLPQELLGPAERSAADFPLLVPRSYLDRIRPGDPHDPLLRQVLPLADELRPVPGFLPDAVGDSAARVAPGLLHKYAGRVLFVATGACAVHCRYCFRRHYPYGDEPKRLDDWQPAFDHVRRDPSVHEVILSGGDPWMLTDRRLGELLERIAAVPHVRRVRFHTRLPIVLPARVTDGLLALLARSRPVPIVVVHANHPQEVTGDCAAALRWLVQAGITTLNQSVLLRGVNDDADVLTGLCERLVDLGVLPYYLHQLDRTAGTAHFEVAPSTGHALIAALRSRLPGYAVPQYVQEVPGEASKRPVPEA